MDEDAVINQPESSPQDEEDQVANDLAKALDTLDLGSKSECKICFKRYVCIILHVVAVLTF